MIPENKQAAVRKALQKAFKVNEFDAIHQLTKGLSSALVFKIVVRGNSYLLRVITRTDAMADPAYYYACMKEAAAAAIAPRIHYMSIEDRVSITDFIVEQPFSIMQAREMMPLLLQQLHSLPKFPHRIGYFESMERFMAKFRASDILPEKKTRDLFDLYERIITIYPRNEPENLVACHNDVKPENIVFDGHRPWLVDWESAFLNDRYFDLAIAANFIVWNEKEEADYLHSYFGEAVDEYKHARFYLMRQILHMYYFTFLLLFYSGNKPIDVSKIETPDFRDFHNGMWDGEIRLIDNNAWLRYAMVHMEQLRYNMQMQRLEDSLRIVAKHHQLSASRY